MKILHTADWHLGIERYSRMDVSTGMSTRLRDYIHSVDQIVEAAREVDVVLIAGDIGDKPVLSPLVQRELGIRLQRMAETTPVVAILGNHDCLAAHGRSCTLDVFASLHLPHVTIERGVGLHLIETKSGPLQVACHSYLSPSVFKQEPDFPANIEVGQEYIRLRVEKNLRDLAQKIDSCVPSVLMLHYPVAGCVAGGYQRAVPFQSGQALHPHVFRDLCFDYVALGDIHKYQEIHNGDSVRLPPTYYSGSIERLDFGEEKEEKGFLVVEIDDQRVQVKYIDFHPLPVRKFLSIRADLTSDNTTEELAEKIGQYDLEGAIVRVLYTLPEGAEKPNAPEVYKALKGAFYVAYVRSDGIVRERRERAIAFGPRLTTREAFAEYLKAQIEEAARRKELEGIGLSIIQTVEERRK